MSIDRFQLAQRKEQLEGEKAVGESTGMKTKKQVLKSGGGMSLGATSRELLEAT